MTAAALGLAIIEGIVLIGFGIIEAFFSRSKAFYPLFRIKPENARAVRLWTINVGFYNITWGLGILVGTVLVTLGDVTVGKTLVLFGSIAMVVLGLVLLGSEPKLWRGAVVQSGLGLVVTIATLL